MAGLSLKEALLDQESREGGANMPETPLPSRCPRSLSDVVVQPLSHVRLFVTP